MFIEVTHRSQAVDALMRGATLWCRETGEGWQLCEPGESCGRSKCAVRRFVSAHYADARYWAGTDNLHFMISWE